VLTVQSGRATPRPRACRRPYPHRAPRPRRSPRVTAHRCTHRRRAHPAVHSRPEGAPAPRPASAGRDGHSHRRRRTCAVGRSPGRWVPICPDLTVGEVESPGIRGSSVGTVGLWVWVVRPSGDDRRIEPNPYSDWHCLLSILDPATFALHRRLVIHSPYPEVSSDGDGRIWIVAGRYGSSTHNRRSRHSSCPTTGSWDSEPA